MNYYEWLKNLKEGDEVFAPVIPGMQGVGHIYVITKITKHCAYFDVDCYVCLETGMIITNNLKYTRAEPVTPETSTLPKMMTKEEWLNIRANMDEKQYNLGRIATFTSEAESAKEPKP